MEKTIPRILITPGEPAGIGPDVLLQVATKPFPAEIVAVADESLLRDRAKMLNIPLNIVHCDIHAKPTVNAPGTLKCISVALNAPVLPGTLNSLNAQYVLRTLEIATDLCLQKQASALVTGPVHKSHMNEADIAFTGHTEFLAARCKAKQVIMLFVVDKIKVALATIHMPLAKVPEHITADHLQNLIRLLHRELQLKFQLQAPRIFVSGLNPHAGENGHLGCEERDIIAPTIQKLRNEGIEVSGPYPADTLFTAEHLAQSDAIVAMYHDQALPVVKYMGFDRAVNMTLGLPIIRTSVDHGTALSLAGSLKADPGSLNAALELAIQLANAASPQ